MNARADVYIGEDDGVPGEVEVGPGGPTGVYFRIDGQIVASAFLDPFQLGVLVGQLSMSAEEVPA